MAKTRMPPPTPTVLLLGDMLQRSVFSVLFVSVNSSSSFASRDVTLLSAESWSQPLIGDGGNFKSVVYRINKSLFDTKRFSA